MLGSFAPYALRVTHDHSHLFRWRTVRLTSAPHRHYLRQTELLLRGAGVKGSSGRTAHRTAISRRLGAEKLRGEDLAISRRKMLTKAPRSAKRVTSLLYNCTARV